MKEIITYIHYLLHEEGKAVLPKLGTLSAHYQPAGADLSKDRFTPPAHRLQFSDMQEDAAATIRQICALTAEPEKQVQQMLEDYVRNLKAALEKEGQAKLEGLGSIHKGRGGQLRFEPEPEFNRQGNAFGLEVFQLKKQSIESQVQEKAPEEPKSPESEKKEAASPGKIKAEKKQTSGLLIAILTLIMIGLIAFFGYTLFFDPPAYISRYMKPLPVLAGEKSIAAMDTIGLSAPVTVAEDTAWPDSTAATTDSLKLPPDTSAAFAKENLAAMEEEKLQESKVQTKEEHFFIVAGLFKTDKGVSGIIRRLTEKGYPAKVFRTNARGINYVCYAGYPDRAAAEEALKKIRELEDPQAWIWPENQ